MSSWGGWLLCRISLHDWWPLHVRQIARVDSDVRQCLRCQEYDFLEDLRRR